MRLGENVGIRMYELLCFRSNTLKREMKHIEILKFVSGPVHIS